MLRRIFGLALLRSLYLLPCRALLLLARRCCAAPSRLPCLLDGAVSCPLLPLSRSCGRTDLRSWVLGTKLSLLRVDSPRPARLAIHTTAWACTYICVCSFFLPTVADTSRPTLDLLPGVVQQALHRDHQHHNHRQPYTTQPRAATVPPPPPDTPLSLFLRVGNAFFEGVFFAGPHRGYREQQQPQGRFERDPHRAGGSAAGRRLQDPHLPLSAYGQGVARSERL